MLVMVRIIGVTDIPHFLLAPDDLVTYLLNPSADGREQVAPLNHYVDR